MIIRKKPDQSTGTTLVSGMHKSSAAEAAGVSKTNQNESQSIWTQLGLIERRQWWLWMTVTLVSLLLLGGLLSFALPHVFEKNDSAYELNLRQAIRGLAGLVVLFDLYAVYQQLQIYRIRRKLLENQRLFHLIGENASDLIAVVDIQGNRIYNSPSYEKVLGYTLEELNDSTSLQQVHPEDRSRLIEASEEARLTGVGRKLEYRFLHKDGTWRFLESSASAVRNADGQVDRLVIINRDITDRKQAEAVLRQKEEQLRQAQKMEAVGRLTGGIAHDFNNLLSVIIGYSEVLEMRLPPNDQLRKNAEEIKKAGNRAASLTSQLLAFSRQQVLQPAVLNLNAVVVDMAQMLRPIIGEDIELAIAMDPTISNVKVDKSKIEQVIMNLVVNSRDAMPKGGTLTIQTTNINLDQSVVDRYPYTTPGPYVQLTVTDTGIGMDEETITHMFEPFFTTKSRGKGTGLGLATVYGVIKQSGGYIWASSKPGEGTSFRICLPRVIEEVEKLSVSTSPVESSGKSETVLLVEDENSLRELVSAMLTQDGYKVLCASSGNQALEIAGAFKGAIDLLLSDVVMPGMTGIDLANQLTAVRPAMRTLFMSGYTEFYSDEHNNLRPDRRLLQKPFSRNALLAEVHKVLQPNHALTLG